MKSCHTKGLRSQHRSKHLSHSRRNIGASSHRPRQRHQHAPHRSFFSKSQPKDQVHQFDDPSCLEFYHFSNKLSHKEKLTTSSPAFGQTKLPSVLSSLQGQRIISRWIADHISLYIQNALKHPSEQYHTKSGALLVGYDVNTQYARDIAAEVPSEQVKLLSEISPSTMSSKVVPLDAVHTKWDELAIVDNGFISFDPQTVSFSTKQQEYEKQLAAYEEWIKLCNGLNLHLDPQDGAQHAERYIAQPPPPARGEPASKLLSGTAPEVAISNDFRSKSFQEMNVDERAQIAMEYGWKVTKLICSISYTLLARSTQLLIPGGATQLFHRIKNKWQPSILVPKLTRWARSASATALTGAYRILCSSAKRIASLFSRICRSSFLLLRNRFPAVVMAGTRPILSGLRSTYDFLYRTSLTIDEWIGTSLAQNPNFDLIKRQMVFPLLAETPPQPGNPPIPPKVAHIPPSAAFYTKVRPYDDQFYTNSPSSPHHMQQLLAAAHIDTQRLLLSYINHVRNSSPLSLGLVPTELDTNRVKIQPHLDERGFIQGEATDCQIPELVLLVEKNPAMAELAGLRQEPQIWLSPHILEHIPAPDLYLVSNLIKEQEGSFWQTHPKTGIAATFLASSILAFSLASGKNIYSDIMQIHEQFPEKEMSEIASACLDYHIALHKEHWGSMLDKVLGRNTDPVLVDEYEQNLSPEEAQALADQLKATVLAMDLTDQEKAQIQEIFAQRFNLPMGNTPGLVVVNNAQEAENAMEQLKQHTGVPLQLSAHDLASIDDVSEEDINDPKLVEQVNHPFGIAQADLSTMKQVTDAHTHVYDQRQQLGLTPNGYTA